MLRIRALSLICLGLLTSCGPSEPLGSTSEGPGEQKALAVLADSTLGPSISVPSSLAFGETPVNTLSSLPLTVSNMGNSVLTVSIAKSGAGASAYTLSSSSLSVAAGGTATVTVSFFPMSQGQANATLTLTTNDPANVTVLVALSGTGVNPKISVPSSLAFGEQPVNTSAQKSLVVTNTGTGTLLVTNPSLSGSGAAAYSVTPSSLSVAAGQSASLVVTFAPTALGTANATLILNTNDFNNPQIAVTLSGKGVNPTISVPSSVAFGDVQVNASATKTVTVSNTGTGTLNITSITTSGPNAAAFSYSPNTLSVVAGGSATLTVVFTPTVVGAATATLTLTSNDPARPTASVSLSGVGVGPTIAVQPTLAFGEQAVNTSAQMILTVSNTGTGTLLISNAVLSGPASATYTVTPTTLSIAAGASANLLVAFTPTTVGVANASLTLTTNDVTHPTVVVTLSGTGVNPTIVVNPVALDFGTVAVGTSATKTLTVSNAGTGTLLIPSITKSGAGAAAYSFSPISLDVPAGQTRSLTVVFTPTAQGQAAASLTLNTNDVTRPTVAISLSGAGGGATAVVSPSVLDFGGVKVGTSRQLTVTVANTGTSPLVVASVTSSTPVFSSSVPVPFTVSPNSSFSFQVAFSPANTVTYTGTLTLTSNASNSPTTVSLTGVGTSAQLSVSPSSIFFGDVRVGTESSRQAVTVVNSGSGEAFVSNISVQGPFAVVLRAGGELPTVIPAAGSYTFDVVFKPTQLGQATGAVNIWTDAGAPLTVALAGNGTGAELRWSTALIDFGAQRLSQPSSIQSVIITNTGTAELEITQLSFSQLAFTLAMTQPPTSEAPLRLAPGQQKALSLVFTPSVLGLTTGKLFAVTNAIVAPPALELKGTAVDGQLSVTPSEVAFGQVAVGASAVRSVSLKNTGSYPLKIVQVTPPSGAPFTVAGLPTGLVVPPGESWPFTVTFAPTQQGTFTATALIQSDSATTPAFSLAMTGVGSSASPSLQVSSSQVAFGNVQVGSSSSPSTLTLTNVGTAPLTLNALALAGVDVAAFTLTAPALPASLQPAASLTVELVFHPSAERSFSGQLRVESNDPVRPLVEVPLTGTGIGHQIPVLSISPSLLDFGSLEVGEQSPSQEISVTNPSSQAVTVTVRLRDDGSPFALDAGGLASPLPPGGSAIFKVSFLPTVVGAAQNEVQVLAQGATEPAAHFTVKGTGVEPEEAAAPGDEGGGCSNSVTGTGGSGLLALLALAALGSRRRRTARG